MKSYSVRPDIPQNVRKNLASYNDSVAHLLFHRGLDSEEKAKDFMNPDFNKHVYDPFLYLNMEKAVLRLRQAVLNKEMICVWADYDADGIPGATLMHDFLEKIGANFFIYIPDRHHEGFGLNSEGVEECASRGTKLMITVDCGIADVEEVSHANSLGIEVIITDHHEPHDIVPDAYAVIDARQKECTYPDKNLCGAAVAWKLASAYLKKFGGEHAITLGWEKWLLDMVGIATLSDMVPLIGENRALAKYGILVLRKSTRPGLRALLSLAGTKQKNISEDDVGFSITPRINAASRMGVPRDAYELLSTKDESTAINSAKKLDKINKERRTTVALLSKDARKHLANGRFDDKSVIVTGDPSWRPSLLGLVANTFAEEFEKPVFLWGRDGDGIIKGSCRTGGGKSVLEIMRLAPAHAFLAYGGHMASGGFEVANDSIHALPDLLHESANLIKIEETEGLVVDTEMNIDDISWKLFEELAALSPFGVSNKKPVFAFVRAVPTKVGTFGKEGNHIKLDFSHKSLGTIGAISFHATPDSFSVKPEVGKPVTLIGNIESNSFGYKKELRLRIIDIL
jgi:single-stranded-DNA-specific exonuclease